MDTQTTNGKAREFRVKSATPPPELGSAIAHAIRDGDHVVLRAVGAGAVNQAVKAIPIAQSFVISYGIDLVQKVSFFNGQSPEGEIRGIAIRVMPHQEYHPVGASA
jgi:stage V sporulation protein S